jgi:hypothetical protein
MGGVSRKVSGFGSLTLNLIPDALLDSHVGDQ